MAFKDVLLQQLKNFFPNMQLQGDKEEPIGEEKNLQFQIISEQSRILSYLQTLFFEERLIEVQLDDGTRLFYGSLWDHPPEPPEEGADAPPTAEEEYEAGSYLKAKDHIVLSPLEPPVGNVKIRSTTNVILRFYTGTTAVELGTTFTRVETVNNLQVLILEFPQVGRVIPNSRPFRAKIPEEFSLYALVSLPGQPEPEAFQIVDFSAMGLSIEHEQLESHYAIGDIIDLRIFDEEEPKSIAVRGTVRHYAKVRTKGGNMLICGIQFDLESRSLAGEIEEMFAKVQRIFIRSIADRAKDQGIRLTLQ